MRAPRAFVFGLLLCTGSAAIAQDCTVLSATLHRPHRGEISRNFYRIPYASDAAPVRIGPGDYWGHAGSFDMAGSGAAPLIVAPADGVVCFIREDLNDCGCHPDFGGCGNLLIIAHANGEYSRHLHIKQWSVSEAGLQVGDAVLAGQFVCREGDVGRTCASSGGNPPRVGTCVTALPPGTGNCAPHDHWNIVRVADATTNPPTMELLQPMTCGIPGNLYAANTAYTPFACESSLCTQTAETLSGYIVDGFGQARVVQNADMITATTAEIRNQAAAVFHAGNRVRLLPGFAAGAGDAYFRAEIGLCSRTAESP